jgi:glycosyltransferase 2 family protein
MGAKSWRITWRLVVCAALMFWICHSIFVNEARATWDTPGRPWTQLTWPEQWQAAWSLGPHQLWRTIRLVQPMAFLVSLGFMGLTILVGLWRWRRVLRVQGLDLPWSRAAEISLVAHFFNSFLLGSTGGDVLKAYFAARETHHKKTEAVVTVYVDRLIGLFAMLAFAVAMMLPNLAVLRQQPRMLAVAWCILAMFVGCTAVVVLSFWGGVSRSWPRARDWLRRAPKGETLERCLEACRRFGREPGFLLRTLGLSMLLNIVCVLQYLALARGLGANVTPLTLFLIVPMVVCIAALPVTPSGLGVRENLYVLLLSGPGIGVAPTEALSLSLLAYAGSLVWSLIGGLVYAGFRERHHLAAVGQAADPPGAD